MKDIDELNTYLRQRCVAERDRVSSRQTDTIGVRFEEDRFRAAALPNHSFAACIRWDAKVDKYQFARFDNVNYSVPRQCAFLSVTVKAYVDRVDIVHLNVIVATHIRCCSHRDQVLNPLHYLATLERRPAAPDHSNVYRNRTLPPVGLLLRERLEERHGARAGVRHYVRVLQLLASHPLARVQSAIEQLRGPEGADADRIIRRVERSAARSQSSPRDLSETHLANSLHDEGVSPNVLSVQVPMPSLDHFNEFLSSSTQGSDDHAPEEKSEFKHEQSTASIGCDTVEAGRGKAIASSDNQRCEPDAREVKPSTVAPANDEGGVRQAGSGGGGIESDVPGLPVATDGTGSGRAFEQRVELTHQTGIVSGSERSGHLRLLGVAIGQQTESPGAFSLRMDFRTT